MGNEEVEEKPLLICRGICKYPHISLAIGIFFHLLFFVLSIILMFTTENAVFYLELSDVPLYDIKYEGYQCFETMRNLDYLSQRYSLIREVVQQPYQFLLYFDAGDKNVFLPESLSEIYKVEQFLMGKLKEKRRELIHNGKTVEPLSLTNILLRFNGNDTTFQNTNNILKVLLTNKSNDAILKTLVCKTVFLNGTQYDSPALISVLYMKGVPSYFIEKTFIEYVRKFYETKFKYWSFYYEDRHAFIADLQTFARRDIKLTIGSMIFIYCFTYLQTRSIFITIFGITSIFTSFFIANFIHSVFFGIKFFGIFHILAIYIVLGLGCDDIYVFLDRWKGCQETEYPSLAHRLSDTYKSANLSMFITSVTTATAFSIMIFTELLALNTFAFFTVLLVIINYLSVLLYFGVVVTVYHIHFESKTQHDRVYIWVTNLFGIHYYNLLSRRFVKESILAVFAIFVIIVIFLLAFKLVISDNFPILLGAGTMYAKLETLKEKCYAKENFDVPLQVSIVNGFRGVNSSECKFWDYNCYRPVIQDESFDVNNKDMQTTLLNLCNMLIHANESLRKEFGIRQLTDKINDVTCFYAEMNTYFINLYNNTLQIPWNLEKFNQLATINPDIYPPIPPTFHYSFEAALDYWNYQEYTFDAKSSDIRRRYAEAIFKQETLELMKTKINDTLFGYKLPVSVIMINTTLYTKADDYYNRVRIFDRWTKLGNDLQKTMRDNTFLVCSTQPEVSQHGHFHWLWVQRTVNEMVIKGILIGLLLAFIIILIATMDILETLFIIFSTILTTLSIVGILPITGQTLGFLEGTNLTLIVGLSVDYIVHMGLSYHRSEGLSRDARLKDMLFEMPVSIVSGAFTTLGACVFLFFCKVKFLFQYGMFLFITIGFATLYGLVFYPSLIGLFGPAKGVGNIPKIFVILWQKFRQRKQ